MTLAGALLWLAPLTAGAQSIHWLPLPSPPPAAAKAPAELAPTPPLRWWKLAEKYPARFTLDLAPPAINADDALKQAFDHRADLKAAEAQVRAAERALSAARAQRLPSLSLSADYGVLGTNPAQSHGTFSVAGSLKFPIFQGGRIEGDIEQAGAALAQRQAELEDLHGQVEADVRKAFLDVETARSQMEVARENIQVSQENLKLTRERFDAGVADNVTVVQSQESVATAELDYINSVFAHNIAKLSLARALGRVAEDLPWFLQVGRQ
jgi:outer membrane protein TolC